MNLEQQVCSLELAKKLKGLGAKQESLFAWLPFGEDYDLFYEYELSKDEHISAFTVAELGEMLPNIIRKSEWLVSTKNMENEWICGYQQYDALIICERADTEADARAKMLIYLLENKLITL